MDNDGNVRDENFWINACLHLIFCNKASRPTINGLSPYGRCEKCVYIESVVDEDKAEVKEDFTYNA
jgi:hypothetical protein